MSGFAHEEHMGKGVWLLGQMLRLIILCEDGDLESFAGSYQRWVEEMTDRRVFFKDVPWAMRQMAHRCELAERHELVSRLERDAAAQQRRHERAKAQALQSLSAQDLALDGIFALLRGA